MPAELHRQNMEALAREAIRRREHELRSRKSRSLTLATGHAIFFEGRSRLAHESGGKVVKHDTVIAHSVQRSTLVDLVGREKVLFGGLATREQDSSEEVIRSVISGTSDLGVIIGAIPQIEMHEGEVSAPYQILATIKPGTLRGYLAPIHVVGRRPAEECSK